MVWLGRGLKGPLIPAPAVGEQVLPPLISAARSWLWKDQVLLPTYDMAMVCWSSKMFLLLEQ